LSDTLFRIQSNGALFPANTPSHCTNTLNSIEVAENVSGGGDSRRDSLIEAGTKSINVGPSISDAVSAAAAAASSLKFLVVDDSTMNRKIMLRLIANLRSAKTVTSEIEVIEADDGITALEQVEEACIQNKPFDCVFIDSVMTLMHGPDAVSIMRSDLNYTGIIIGVTGNALPHEIALFKSKGANEVLLKPLTFKVFVSMLKKMGILNCINKGNKF
jgi:CheY-like chemotaxis protein